MPISSGSTGESDTTRWNRDCRFLTSPSVCSPLRGAAGGLRDNLNRWRQQIGLADDPSVRINGFPFLTQIISKHLVGLDISAPNFLVGPVMASMQVQVTDIALNSGYESGTIAHITGTSLITFSSLSRLAGVEGAPGGSCPRASRRHRRRGAARPRR